ncbi:integral membrane sensor signal transduction histidine kinase [Cellulomonas gilvus ATCC 13127]|uniref:histidine kinase n=1 Tax=Cellulomonas gilvus (strain ATCC 13127 / NRRL B-14078) TaxID=593907 RepID=F8A3G7_CELGA|nr:integral membrane sensor signal transduction histidine kinase [Cellulomonas gilvus ATCC 13127]
MSNRRNARGPALVVHGAIARRRRVAGFVLAGAGLPVISVLLVATRDDVALGSILLVYLLGVVAVSAVGGMLPGLIAAVLSFGLANWFFTPPLHTLAVEGGDTLIELAVFAVAAVVVAATVELAARDRLRYQQDLDAQVARTRELAAEDRARTALLASVGHDLRTPLASTKAAVSSLRQTDVAWPDDARAQLLATIEDSTDRLARLVANLLDMTRLRSDAVTARVRPIALDEVLARTTLGEHRASVDTVIADDLPLVLVDPGLLERVVDNLVENAVRFSPAGTRVRIRAATGRSGVDLSIVDHGPGIPPERRDEVFAAFQRLDDRDAGSHVGLGLAIARGFTEAMGVDLSPSTTPGGGLTMTLRPPVAPQ